MHSGAVMLAVQFWLALHWRIDKSNVRKKNYNF